MSGVVPRAARSILERGVLCHLAVRAPAEGGLHVTPVVFVLSGGRVWLTTSRRSVKARAWREDPAVAGMVRVRGGTVSFQGRVRTYDAFDPLSWPAAAVGGPRLATAATRFALKNARFFAGYAVDARRVPLRWSPPGRVFAAVRVWSGFVLDAEGRPVVAWGEEGTGPERRTRPEPPSESGPYLMGFGPRPRRRGLDLRAPADVRRVIGPTGAGAVAMEGRDGRPVVLPARWRRVGTEGAFDAAVSRWAMDLADLEDGEIRAALVADHASAWRASAMAGLLLQGPARCYAPGDTRRGARALGERIRATGHHGPVEEAALVRVEPDRVVWWRGWTSGTVAQGDRTGRPSTAVRAART